MRLLQQTRSRFGLFSGSTLKMIACLFMLIDHAGMIIFPENPIWRWLGRLAFPLFAFFMAEGCRYSKKPLKRFYEYILPSPALLFVAGLLLCKKKVSKNIKRRKKTHKSIKKPGKSSKKDRN